MAGSKFESGQQAEQVRVWAVVSKFQFKQQQQQQQQQQQVRVQAASTKFVSRQIRRNWETPVRASPQCVVYSSIILR